jgi:hypothetical protein
MASSGKTRLHRFLRTHEFRALTRQILLTGSLGTISSHAYHKWGSEVNDEKDGMLFCCRPAAKRPQLGSSWQQ